MKHYTNTSNPVDFPKLSAVDRLWGEALDRAVPDTYSTLSWTQVERIKTVFAELIVKECMEVCKSRVGNSDYNTGRMHCVSDLKEHFGVEE